MSGAANGDAPAQGFWATLRSGMADRAKQDVTRLLEAWNQGETGAREQLLPLVYDELRRVARAHLRRERPDHTLQATALVHEAYIRLLGPGEATPRTRPQLFGIAAR